MIDPAVPSLQIEGLRFSYGGPPILDGVELSLGGGELVGVLGPNGAGKTTLIRLATGALAPDAGSVRLFGDDLALLPRRERARRAAVVPQETRTVFDFSVREIVLMGRSPHLGLLGVESRRDQEAAAAAMRFTGIDDLADRPMTELSGGERRRALIARALAQEAPLLLLDEPTAYLDIKHRIAVYRIVERLRSGSGRTVVVVSHDINLAARFCPRILLLHRGRIVADGPAGEVITRDNIRRVYDADVRVRPDPDARTPMVLP